MFEKFLAGKTAVVTGSNSGIGLGIAHELAKAGADLVLNSFTDTPEDHALADTLSAQHGVTVRYIQADMSKPAECRALIERAGACDILVNNAGIQHVAPIPEFPAEKWDAIIAINLSSAFHTTAAALPVTKVTALETAKEAITCNAICPGYVLTPIVEKQIPDQMKANNMTREEVLERVILERQPSREFATVEQLGGTAVFLCSSAADQITGTTISVDGGWTAL